MHVHFNNSVVLDDVCISDGCDTEGGVGTVKLVLSSQADRSYAIFLLLFSLAFLPFVCADNKLNKKKVYTFKIKHFPTKNVSKLIRCK